MFENCTYRPRRADGFTDSPVSQKGAHRLRLAPALVGSGKAARKVHLEVDASALGPDGEGMERPVTEALGPKLEAAGWELVEAGEIGVLGGVGIGVAALGVGGVIWGAVDLSRGRVYDDGVDVELGTQPRGTDFSPRGRAMLGAGIAAIVVGGALLGTDLAIRAKKRKQARPQNAMIVPLASPQQVGLGWIQQF